MTSPDGITWTTRTSAADNLWNCITYGNGVFVAVASSGTGNRVMTSSDGINWTARASISDNMDWDYVTYGNGLFVASASSGSSTAMRIMTSTNGISWTGRHDNINYWNCVTYGNGLFVALRQATTNGVITSPDGINWSYRDAPVAKNWRSITYGNGLFVAVSYEGNTDQIMTSPDGINWTARNAPVANQWWNVTYGNGLFVAVAGSGTGNRIMTSPDGINWTIRNSPADNAWYGLTYSNGLFVAVSVNGSGNQVMTSGTFGVLPLQWGKFDAQQKADSVLLTWTTLQEQNTQDFQVQHSINAQQWTAVGTLPAAGNSNTVRNYQYVHQGPFKTSMQHYYRILQRDLDGKFSYSKVIRIEYPEAATDVVLYPNPTSDILNVHLTEREEIRLVNMQGIVVWKGVLPAGRHEIPVSHFAAGNYILQAGKGTYKVMIQ